MTLVKTTRDVVDARTGEYLFSYIRVAVDFTGDQGKTRQEFKDDVDINQIVSRIRRGLPVPVRAGGAGVFGDFSAGNDFTAAAEAVADARERFSELSADLKKRFRNDPAQLLAALERGDQAELLELAELGLPEIYLPPAVVTQATQQAAARTIQAVGAQIAKGARDSAPPSPPTPPASE